MARPRTSFTIERAKRLSTISGTSGQEGYTPSIVIDVEFDHGNHAQARVQLEEAYKEADYTLRQMGAS